MRNQAEALGQLASLLGVQTDYLDMRCRRQPARSESLLATLRALGVPLERADDAGDALRQHRLALWMRPVEPAVVAWQGQAASLRLRLPATSSPRDVRCVLKLEDGTERRWTARVESLKAREQAEVEGMRFIARDVPLPGDLPGGLHALDLELGRRTCRTTVVAAPRQAHQLAGRSWGVFLPLYALRSARSGAVGSYRDLAELVRWTADQGGKIVATLPLLPGFFDEPFEPSPYAPVSRLFWNELFVDPGELVPKLPVAWKRLRGLPQVDYRAQFALLRKLLAPLAGKLDRWRPLLRQNPAIEDYAVFRAVCTRQRCGWPVWPERLRQGQVKPGDYDESDRRFYLLAQCLAQEQIGQAAQAARQAGAGLYLDLPIGVHADSYDTWRYRRLFAAGSSAGAPPDPGFPGGQDWGFTPLHPQRIREDGYRYVSALLRHHMQHAAVLRIDHVMSLHRLFWIPPGMKPADGVYVRYPCDELYAVIALESQRSGCAVVGENLGTVPPEVGPAMNRHALMQMYVVQYELDSLANGALRRPPPASAASFNTHDMAPFAAWWKGGDIRERRQLGLIDRGHAAAERRLRQQHRLALVRFLRQQGWLKGRAAASAHLVYRACLGWLAANGGRLTLLNLEDLWAETVAQNVPGTSSERPNWRHQARLSLEELASNGRVARLLRLLDGRWTQRLSEKMRGKC